MRKIVASLFAFFAWLLVLAPLAEAQQSIPTMPPNTVFGRLSGGGLAGPGGAIPLSTLAAQIIPSLPAAQFVIPDSYGTVDRTGATDMGAIINTTIAAAKSCQAATAGAGLTTVYLRAGTYLITTPILPKSCVTIQGDGPGRTVLLTNNSAPFAQQSGSQLVHFNLRGVTFKDSGSHSSATVMLFTAIQGSRIENIRFQGYASGTLMSIAGATVSTFDDTSAIFNNSNSIFNTFQDWVAEDGCANCIMEAGAYGSTTTSSPPSSSNQPSIVVTQNLFDNINIWACSGKCIDLIKAVDTEVYRHVVLFMNSNSAIAAQIGDDNANFPGNNYVNSQRIQISISILGPATTALAFRAGDWTFGNVIDLETDVVPSAFTLASAQASVTQFKLEVCGKSTPTSLIDPNGFNTNRLCQSNDFGSGAQAGASYIRLDNGSNQLPIIGFTNDTLDGLYLAQSTVPAFNKNLRIDGHIWGGAAAVPGLSACGTSPSFTGTASDTAGQIVTGSSATTACTITFGVAFLNVPYCTFTPVGQSNSGLFVATNSTTAITLNYTSATSLKIDYICIAAPNG